MYRCIRVRCSAGAILVTLTEFSFTAEGEDEDGTEEETDVPRDSGCFESTEVLENGREDPDSEPEKEPESALSGVQEQMQGLTVED